MLLGSSASAGRLQRRRRLVTRPRISRPDPVKRPPPPAPPPRRSRARLGLRWLLAERRRNKRSGVPAAGFRRFSAEDLAEFGQEMFQGIAPAGNNFNGAAMFRGAIDNNAYCEEFKHPSFYAGLINYHETQDGNRDDLDAD